MKNTGVVAALAAAAALAGCLDPQYKSRRFRSEPPAPPQVALPDPEPIPPAPVPGPIVVDVIQPRPQTVPAPVDVEPVSPPVVVDPPAPATTAYIVQRGDTLSKISKRFNITIAAIRRTNPQLKGDALRIGQKLELPGAVDVGEQKRPTRSFQPSHAAGFKKYTGETRDYTVVAGDSLSKIAHQTGCTVAQLADLNGLERDMVRIGQKLRVPAKKAAQTAAPAARGDSKPAPADDKPKAQPAAPAPEVKPDAAPQPELKLDEAPQPEPPADADKEVLVYKVSEGDDIAGLSITFDVAPARLRQLNNLADDAPLTPGMEIKIPVTPN